MYLRINGIQSGPFSMEEVSSRYVDGALDRCTMSWCEGEQTWMTLGKRWPTHQPKLRRVLAAIAAIAAAGAALAMPAGLIEMLPVSMQSGTLLWCCVIGLLAITVLCLRAAERRNSHPRTSLVSVVLAIALAGCGLLALTLTVLNSAVLQFRARAANALVSFDEPLNSIRVQGEIGPRLPEQVQSMLVRHPDARGIELDSPGGLVTDAIKVAGIVRTHGLAARVDGECASACVAIWAASPRHQMTASSRLGLHQIRFELDMPHQIIGRAKEKLKQEYDGLLRGAGFNEQVIAEKDRTPPAHVFWLDPAQVADSGVTLEIYDSGGARVSPATAKWLWVEAVLGTGNPMNRLMEAIRRHAAPLMPTHAEELYATLHGNDGDAVRRAGHSLSSDARQFAFAHASDRAVVDWGRSLHDTLDRALAGHDAYTCAVLSGNKSPDQVDPAEKARVADETIGSLSRMIEALPADAVGAPGGAGAVLTRSVAQQAWKNAISEGYPSQSARWSVFQHCRYLADYYGDALQLPLQQAAEVIRFTERSK